MLFDTLLKIVRMPNVVRAVDAPQQINPEGHLESLLLRSRRVGHCRREHTLRQAQGERMQGERMPSNTLANLWLTLLRPAEGACPDLTPEFHSLKAIILSFSDVSFSDVNPIPTAPSLAAPSPPSGPKAHAALRFSCRESSAVPRPGFGSATFVPGTQVFSPSYRRMTAMANPSSCRRRPRRAQDRPSVTTAALSGDGLSSERDRRFSRVIGADDWISRQVTRDAARVRLG